jgi:hypothetical protein
MIREGHELERRGNGLSLRNKAPPASFDQAAFSTGMDAVNDGMSDRLIFQVVPNSQARRQA